ncbi:hypothetical protein [Leptolyngbya sp. FACHB-261]|uniref:hypothetical protein n=1 Tax=Leptolyngbya sp. FACHB-261 TaxID=2692806 RepID=UPI001685601C|nr:hypothetical protein [Leptolyngbya sp. FACHB-261]MBD2105150.1 hypothetical protein [Leptolyngbya sp. FACHB-261]
MSKRRRRAITSSPAEIPGQPEEAAPQASLHSCQSDSSLHEQTGTGAVGPELGPLVSNSCQDTELLHESLGGAEAPKPPQATTLLSCQSSQVWHDSLTPVGRAATHLTQAVAELQQAVRELVAQGTREGSIAAYPKPNGRTYYNHVTCEQGKVKPVYLPLKHKLKAEAEIERGHQASKLQVMCDQLSAPESAFIKS